MHVLSVTIDKIVMEKQYKSNKVIRFPYLHV